jgi:hypothetical protein
MSEFLIFIIESMEAFYSLTGSLLDWLTDTLEIGAITILGIEFPGFEFIPINIIFSWGTLVVVLGIVMYKKLVPGAG